VGEKNQEEEWQIGEVEKNQENYNWRGSCNRSSSGSSQGFGQTIISRHRH